MKRASANSNPELYGDDDGAFQARPHLVPPWQLPTDIQQYRFEPLTRFILQKTLPLRRVQVAPQCSLAASPKFVSAGNLRTRNQHRFLFGDGAVGRIDCCLNGDYRSAKPSLRSEIGFRLTSDRRLSISFARESLRALTCSTTMLLSPNSDYDLTGRFTLTPEGYAK